MRHSTQQKWQALIQQQSTSNLTTTRFCKVKKISPFCFFKYRKIIQGQSAENDEGNHAFVKIQPLKAKNNPSLIKLQYHDSMVSLPSTLEPAWIASLLKALS